MRARRPALTRVLAASAALALAAAGPASHAGKPATAASARAMRASTMPMRASAGAMRASTAPSAIVPRPLSETVRGGSYVWPDIARVSVAGVGARNVADMLRAYLAANGVGVDLIDERSRQRADVVLQLSRGFDARLGDEGYALDVRPDGIALRANAAAGLFYGLQTLEQITARSDGHVRSDERLRSGELRSRAETIVDRPAYRWRGIHLDVARHFFSVPVVERYIDVAAHYKLNTFHWHLTDDTAWRLRSDRYPALANGGSAYSKADVAAVVAYAARRYVTVVPELDLPAHAAAVARAYPQLACGRATLCTTGAGLAFARTVLGEAAAQFPARYVHAGGDEVPAGAAAAQPAFTDALERFASARGRRLVGWDEILTPRLSPRAVVMVWTSRKRAALAARHGNDVVVTSAPLYFDAAQGDAAQEPLASAHMSTLEQVYSDRVTPDGLTAAQAAHVLGGQANVWTEHVATADHLFYMLLPRELALAETVWTPRERKDWGSFLARLPAQFRWLDAHGYRFRIPNASFAVSGNGGTTAFAAVPGRVQAVDALTDAPAVTVALSAPIGDAVIRYTTDGSAPSAASRAYARPFAVTAGTAPVRIRAAVFVHGRAGAVTECAIVRTPAAAIRARTGTAASWSALVSP